MSELQCVARLKVHDGNLDRLPPVGALAADSRSGRKLLKNAKSPPRRTKLFATFDPAEQTQAPPRAL
jgi:hypothetical protein